MAMVRHPYSIRSSFGCPFTFSKKYVSNVSWPNVIISQGWHRLEKYLNLEGYLEKSLKVNSALKSTGKSLKGLEKSLNSSIFRRT